MFYWVLNTPLLYKTKSCVLYDSVSFCTMASFSLDILINFDTNTDAVNNKLR